MAKLEELGLVPYRRSKRLKSQNPPLAETISPPCSFMNDVNDDFLIEILLGLSDARLAVQCGLVSKRWSFLIFSDEFRKRFNQNHRHHFSRYLDPSYSLPYTLLFTFLRRKIDDITFTSHTLSSNALSGIHYYRNSADYLDFLPEKGFSRRIDLSSGDLVLSDKMGTHKYCVSNPLTKQWKILPQDMPPLMDTSGSGLWLDPNRYGFDRRLGNYMVLLIDANHDFKVNGDNYTIRAVMFCSESEKWSERILKAPRTYDVAEEEISIIMMGAVQSRGFLYFPVGNWWKLKGFLAVDPVGSSECRLLNLPDGFGDGWKTFVMYRVGYGVVRGRVRLCQFLKNYGSIDLKVWELCDDNNETTWVLVHDVSVKRDKRKTISVVSFDPNDGDVVFMVINTCICKYNMRLDEYEKVGQLPNIKRTRLEKEYVLWNFLKVYTIQHNSWPVLPI